MADLQVTTSVVEGVAAQVKVAAAPLAFAGPLRSADAGVFQSAAVSGALADSSGLRGARAELLGAALDDLRRTTSAAASQLDALEAGLAKWIA